MPIIQTRKKTNKASAKHSLHISECLIQKMGFSDNEEVQICFNINSRGVKQLIITGLGTQTRKEVS